MKMIRVPIVFRGPNGAAAGVTAQHSQVESRVNLIKGNACCWFPPPPPHYIHYLLFRYSYVSLV